MGVDACSDTSLVLFFVLRLRRSATISVKISFSDRGHDFEFWSFPKNDSDQVVRRFFRFAGRIVALAPWWRRRRRELLVSFSGHRVSFVVSAAFSGFGKGDQRQRRRLRSTRILRAYFRMICKLTGSLILSLFPQWRSLFVFQ